MCVYSWYSFILLAAVLWEYTGRWAVLMLSSRGGGGFKATCTFFADVPNCMFAISLCLLESPVYASGACKHSLYIMPAFSEPAHVQAVLGRLMHALWQSYGPTAQPAQVLLPSGLLSNSNVLLADGSVLCPELSVALLTRANLAQHVLLPVLQQRLSAPSNTGILSALTCGLHVAACVV